MNYEYKVLPLGSNDPAQIEAALNTQGADGWLLVSFVPGAFNNFNAAFVAVFQRPL